MQYQLFSLWLQAGKFIITTFWLFCSFTFLFYLPVFLVNAILSKLPIPFTFFFWGPFTIQITSMHSSVVSCSWTQSSLPCCWFLQQIKIIASYYFLDCFIFHSAVSPVLLALIISPAYTRWYKCVLMCRIFPSSILIHNSFTATCSHKPCSLSSMA